jgi:hypothetical protein
MIDRSQYEWLEWMDRSGPFLAEPVLAQVMPQGLETVDPLVRKNLRQAYGEWRDAVDNAEPRVAEYHTFWVDHVLREVLDFDAGGADRVLKTRSRISEEYSPRLPEHGVTLTADYLVVAQEQHPPAMLIKIYPPDADLDAILEHDGWASPPAERMVQHCRALGTRLGLITNGERWILVDAPEGGVTSFASWYARLWLQEPVTLQAFTSLLGVSRFFTTEDERLPALFDKSLDYQDEVTDALGEQVRRAVEVLIQSLDRADVDRNRELLVDVEPKVLYEAGLTVMMRLVFLLSAEERGLLLLGDNRYEQNYAVSTLRMQLRAESNEILERRHDAWARLLAIFRAVYGGVEHETLRLPALGGSLFDPDRFPFLEGRSGGSSWKDDPADPLPIDNRTVLLLLNAIQLFEGRTLSYRGLDIEQLGYVYEGLLDHTVVRSNEATLELSATKSAKNPWATLAEVESASEKGESELKKLLKERTASSASRIRNDLAKEATETDAERLLATCHGDHELRDRIRPYFHFLEIDQWGYPLVYPADAFMVGKGLERRQTGSHYTPKSLTEAIVKETLEPVAYIGPAEGKPREAWALRSPEELLDLKICDPAMGSGAFLVQVCRWLGERLIESWQRAEEDGMFVSADGEVLKDATSKELLSPDAEERTVTARRLIAERCIYGVDINPLAVELGKLSIWLITLAKGRPFGFLDHNLKSGDSLLGINQLQQLTELNLNPKGAAQTRLFGQSIKSAVIEALELRKRLRETPIRDIHDVEAMARLDSEAREKLALPGIIADAFIGAVFSGGKKGAKESKLVAIGSEADSAFKGERKSTESLAQTAATDLATDSPSGQARHPFHWPLAFPEVFAREGGGFDAIVGNPPFLGGQRITGAAGTAYRDWLVGAVAAGTKGSADLVAYFFLQCHALLRPGGIFGLLAVNTIAEGDTRTVGLERLLGSGGATIVSAYPNEAWPGSAAVVTSRVHLARGSWQGEITLNGQPVNYVSAFLSDQEEWTPEKLKANEGKSFQGSIILGLGFTLSEEEAQGMIARDPKNEDVLFPYLNGKDLNSHPQQQASRWVINFFDWTEERAKQYAEPYSKAVRDVKPERQLRKPNGDYKQRKPLPEKWWIYAEKRPALYHAIGRGDSFESHPKGWARQNTVIESVLVCSEVTKHLAISSVPAAQVLSSNLDVFVADISEILAPLVSIFHTEWAWKYSSKLETRLKYSPGNAFETFPFPKTSDLQALGKLGESYQEIRAMSLKARNIGLTKFYNFFHDPDCDDEDVTELRTLRVKMDLAVADAYGWNDLSLDHDFHEVDYLPENDRVRYTVSREVRIEILERLSILNKERYEEEVSQGLHGAKRAPKTKTPKKSGALAASEQQGINFGDADSEAAE